MTHYFYSLVWIENKLEAHLPGRMFDGRLVGIFCLLCYLFDFRLMAAYVIRTHLLPVMTLCFSWLHSYLSS